MKKTKIPLIALLALTLVGCGTTTSSSSDSSDTELSQDVSTSESDKTSESVSEGGKDSSTQESSGAPESNTETGSESETPVESTVPPSEGSDSETSGSTETTEPPVEDGINHTAWPDDIWQSMRTYLNGNVLPYTRLANKDSGYSSSVDTDSGALVIEGTLDCDAAMITSAKNIYDNEGWDTSKSTSTKLVASLATKNLSVTLESGADGWGTVLTAKWDEPYDASTFTAWPTQVIDDFTTYLNGNILPLIYLGTKAPVSQISSSGKQLNITGGDWNAQVISDASATLTADGWTLESTSAEDLKASKLMVDQWNIKLELQKNSSDRILLAVTWDEPFVAPVNGDWQQSTKDVFDLNFDGIYIDYLYLGTLNETTSVYASLKEVDVIGNDWNDRILTDPTSGARVVYGAGNGWTVTQDGNGTSSSDQYIAHKDFTGVSGTTATMTIKLYKYYNGTARLEIYYKKSAVAPVGKTDWEQATKDQFTQYLDGKEIPFYYIGTETCTWSDSDMRLTITGDIAFDDTMLTDYSTILKNDGWTVSTKAEQSYSYSAITVGEKSYSDGSTITVEFYKKGYSNSYPEIRVNYRPRYQTPAGVTDWDQVILDDFDTYLAGNHIPFVYLNAATVDSYWLSYSGALNLTGGVWDDAMLTAATTAFTAAGWENIVTIDNSHASGSGNYSEKEFNADYTDSFGNKLEVKLYGDYSAKANMYIYFTEGFNPSVATDWSQDIKDDMTDNLGYVMPYVYLGAKDPTSYWDSSSYLGYSKLQVKGNTWDDAIWAEIKAAYTEADDWDLTEIKDSTGATSKMYMTKIFPDNSMIYAVISKSSQPQIDYYYAAPYTFPATDPTKDVWGTELTDPTTGLFAQYLGGNTVPFFYIGDGPFIASYDDDGFIDYHSTSTTSWHDQYILNAKSILEADGFTCTYDSALASYSLKLIATKDVTGGTVKVIFYKGYSDNAIVEFYFFPTYHKPADGSVIWNQTITDKMNDKLGFVLPYIYLGAETEDLVISYESSTEFDIKGGTWSFSIYQDMLDSLAYDTSTSGRVWEHCYDTSYSSTKLIAHTQVSTVKDDGTTATKDVTLKLYKRSGDEKPVLEIYYGYGII